MSTFTRAVRKLFALPRSMPRLLMDDSQIDYSQFLPGRGHRVLITGASGSGKSRMLSKLKERYQDQVHWIDPAKIILEDIPVIDLVCRELSIDNQDEKIMQGLDILSRVGLAEAWTYLRKPSEISEGQRWRLLLVISLQRAKNDAKSRAIVILAMDEFAALLDRITAIIIARSLRKLIDATHEIGVIVATSHNDLAAAFDPHIHIYCDFGVTRIIRKGSQPAENSNRGQNENQQQDAANDQQCFK